MKKYKYILFDADNTLFDFDMCEKEAFKNALNFSGIECTDEIYSSYHIINEELWKKLEIGLIDRDSLKTERFRLTFEKHGLNNADHIRVAEFYENDLGKHCYEIDGAFELVEKLSEKYDIYIITNGLTSVQKSRFSLSRITQFVKRVFVSEDVGYSKPNKLFFERVLNCIGADKNECIVICDSISSDIDGAINSGIDCIWYNRKHADPAGRHPDYEIDSISAVERIL
ncbi:MAG: YjjG family noncanonical pyrimidine nucleotidase [Clostridia bacterium]|nr:YjjG family noncanonical pyrimidine nucleotidase [Clostridia bacterium]